MSVKIIYGDNHVLLVEKPYGMATQPTLHEQAKAWIKRAYHKKTV